jgi:plastocyanin domain-containing protein
MKTLVIVLGFIVLVACAGGEQRNAEEELAPSSDQETTASGSAVDTATAVRTPEELTIDVAGTFTPASVTIPANTPMKLHFRRSDKPTCADEIVLTELNMRKKIAANETVTFDIPAQQTRTLNFACGMNMMKGTVVVQ